MNGLMMNMPMQISSLMEFADRYHGSTEIVTKTVEGGMHRYNYKKAHHRTKKLANALINLGVKKGDRIATLAWNTFRHFEIYFAVSGIGAICHTINPRLFPNQITYIANHAEDTTLFLDTTFIPLVEKICKNLKTIRNVIILAEKKNIPSSNISNIISYEDFISEESGEYNWPQLDENTASSLCYTSGTTGNPKGVLYSHRSTIIHSYAAVMPDTLNISARDIVMPVVPMFHANAWGLPYAAALTGSKLVFPGSSMDGKSIYNLFEKEKVTLSAGVPTIWMGLLSYVQENNLTFSVSGRTVIGGSACPPAMIRNFEKNYGIEVIHAWGMTEMSPLGTVSTFLAKQLQFTDEEKFLYKDKQGRVIFGVDMKIIDAEGNELPWDGKTFGDLYVRGPFVIEKYFKEKNSPLIEDNNKNSWFPTGDVATIDPDGFMQITDRSKDVIKTGGEWISSIELENIAVENPNISEAAVISCYHPKWEERPLLIAVKKQGKIITKEEILKFYEGKVVKWWIPNDVIFVDNLPHTATGKLLKTKLREDYKNFKFTN